MSQSLVELYTDARFFSPYAMSVFVTLTEKNIPFTLKPIDLSQCEHQSALYGAISLTRRVPTLIIGDFQLSESSAIDEYLEDLYPTHSVYPRDIRQRAKAREIQAWLRSDLVPLRIERPTNVIFNNSKLAPLTAEAEQTAQTLIAAANKLLKPGQETLFGEWCIADTDLALMLNRLVFHNEKVPEHLQHYAQTQWQRPSVKSWLALSNQMKG